MPNSKNTKLPNAGYMPPTYTPPPSPPDPLLEVVHPYGDSGTYKNLVADMPIIATSPSAIWNAPGIGTTRSVLFDQVLPPWTPTQSPSPFWQSLGGSLSGIGQGLGHTFMKIWDSRIGSAILVGGLVTLGIYLANRGGSDTPMAARDKATLSSLNTTVYSKSAAWQNNQQEIQHLSRTLIGEGIDADVVQAAGQRTAFIIGTSGALARPALPTPNNSNRSTLVLGSAPNRYRAVDQLDMDAFVDSLAKPQHTQDVMSNTVLIHEGLSTK